MVKKTMKILKDTEVMHDIDDNFEAGAANMEEDDESNFSSDITALSCSLNIFFSLRPTNMHFCAI